MSGRNADLQVVDDINTLVPGVFEMYLDANGELPPAATGQVEWGLAGIHGKQYVRAQNECVSAHVCVRMCVCCASMIYGAVGRVGAKNIKKTPCKTVTSCPQHNASILKIVNITSKVF